MGAADNLAPMHDAVSGLCDDSGPLQRVTGVIEGGITWSLSFEFAAGILTLNCDRDTDEIIAEVGDVDPEAREVEAAWVESLLGKRIMYGWILKNHRGFDDGFQLSLYDDGEERTYRCIQFEVAASSLHLRQVSDWLPE